MRSCNIVFGSCIVDRDGDAGGIVLDNNHFNASLDVNLLDVELTAVNSGSSLPKKLNISRIVTLAPNRRCACANSAPRGPLPTTIKWSGRLSNPKIVSLVRYGASANPGVGGTIAADPVAMTNRHSSMRASPA